MAGEDKKVKFAIDMTIDAFGESKHKGKQPPWFAARPDKIKMVPPLKIKRTVEVDGRKWKKKVLEDGVYAVARYELAILATKCAAIEKEVIKARAKDKTRAKAKFIKNDKNEPKDEKDTLDKAASAFNTLYKKLAVAILDKVDLALDEVESDTGDNKRALSQGKEALKKFNDLDTDTMFKTPTLAIGKVFKDVGDGLGKDPENGDQLFGEALKRADTVDKEFDKTGRIALNAIKHLITSGEKMAKDTGANAQLVKIGKDIRGPVSKQLSVMEKAIDEYGKELEKTLEFFKKPKGKTREMVNTTARTFVKNNGGRDKTLKGAINAVKKVGKDYSAAAKDLK